MEFQVGEKVIYPTHGIGVVESIQTRPTPAGKVSLYQLRLLSNDSRVWVPEQNVGDIGLRPVTSASGIRKIFVMLADGTVEQQNNWKGRFRENSDKMRTGSLFEVAVVLKGLAYLSLKKALSFREKKMLDRARYLVVTEVAECEGKPQAAIEDRIDQALSKTFSQESRPTQRPVVPPRRSNS